MARRAKQRIAGGTELIVTDPTKLTKFLGGGYLPEVLPPIFTSHPFSLKSVEKRVEVDARAAKALERISYSCTKRGYARRLFDVMHPVSAVFSANWLASHWDTIITAHCNKPGTTAAELALSDDFFSRSIKTPSFDSVHREVKNRTARARHFIRADIAKFYPSIYTHSIPWALHGKDAAKANTNPNDPTVFGNKIDWALRLGQSGQTKGIPIGTDISRVVAEIIGAAVDRAVQERCSDKLIGYIRNIDDFYIGCANLSDAESILSTLSNALRTYELSLNDEKTHIHYAHEFYDDDWAVELDSFLASNTGERKKVIERAFDRTFLYATKNRADSSLKFLIRMVDKEISAELVSFEDVQYDLIRSFVNFPHCSDYVMTMLFVRAARGENYDKNEWALAINNELARHAIAGHHHEICWLLSAAYICGTKITDSESITRLANPLNISLAYLLAENSLLDVTLNETFVPLINDQMSSSNWILVHEGINRNWFPKKNIKYDYRAGFDTVLGDGLTFLDNAIVDEFAKVGKGNPAIPDRYERYDELESEGYVEFLVRQKIARDDPIF